MLLIIEVVRKSIILRRVYWVSARNWISSTCTLQSNCTPLQWLNESEQILRNCPAPVTVDAVGQRLMSYYCRREISNDQQPTVVWFKWSDARRQTIRFAAGLSVSGPFIMFGCMRRWERLPTWLKSTPGTRPEEQRKNVGGVCLIREPDIAQFDFVCISHWVLVFFSCYLIFY